MADTIRPINTLLTTLFQDGQATGSITPQRIRDMIVSVTDPATVGFATTGSNTFTNIQTVSASAVPTGLRVISTPNSQSTGSLDIVLPAVGVSFASAISVNLVPDSSVIFAHFLAGGQTQWKMAHTGGSPGVAYQSAGSHNFADAGGNQLIQITSTGTFNATRTGQNHSFNGLGITGSTTGAGLSIYPATASAKGLIVQGLPNQSSNLQEWQDSNGNKLGYVQNNGIFGVNAVVSYNAGNWSLNDTDGLALGSLAGIKWGSGLAYSYGKDVGLARSGSGVLQVTNGSTGLGGLLAGASTFVSPNSTTPAQIIQLATSGANASQGLRIVDSSGADMIDVGTNVSGWPTVTGVGVGSPPLVLTAGGGVYYGNTLFGAAQVQLSRNGGNSNSINQYPVVGIGLIVAPPDSGSKGLVVRGLVSQSGNTFEIQNNTGTSLAYFDNNGNLNAGAFGLTNNNFGATSVGVGLSNTAAVLWSSTSNWSQTKDVGLSRLTSGSLVVTNGSTGLGGLLVGASTSASVPLTVSGAVGQTANLQEWRDSNNSVVANIFNTGTFNAATYIIGGNISIAPSVTNLRSDYKINWQNVTNYGGTSDVGLARSGSGVLQVTNGSTGLGSLVSSQHIVNAPNSSSAGLIVKNVQIFSSASVDAPLTTFTDASGTTLVDVRTDTVGRPYINFAGGSNITTNGSVVNMSSIYTGGTLQSLGKTTLATGGGQNNSINGGGITGSTTGAGLVVYPATGSAKGLIVQGLANQTGNLLDLQDSTGNSNFYATSNGAAYSYGGFGDVFSQFMIGANRVSGSPALEGASGLQVRWSSTTNQSGTKDVGLSRLTSGSLQVTNGSTGLGGLLVGSPTGSQVALTVSGAVGQTANIFEVRDSSGNLLLNTQTNGLSNFSNTITGTGASFSGNLYSNVMVQLARYGGFNNSINGSNITGSSTGAGLVVYPATGSAKGLVVQALANQTGNPFEIQNSSGATLSYVDANGITLAGGFVTYPYAGLGTGGHGLNIGALYDIAWSNTGSYANTKDVGLARSGSGVLQVTNGSTGFGSLLIGQSTGSNIGLAIRVTSSAASDALQIQNSAGSMVSRLDQFGGAFFGNTVYMPALIDGNNNFSLTNTGVSLASTSNVRWSSTTGYNGTADVGLIRSGSGVLQVTNGSTGLGSLLVGSATSASVPLTVSGAASQTANLLEVRNSIGTTLTQVIPDGQVGTRALVVCGISSRQASSQNDASIFVQDNGGASSVVVAASGTNSKMSLYGNGAIYFSSYPSPTFAGSVVQTGLVQSSPGVVKVTSGSSTGGGGLQVGSFATASRPSASVYGVGTMIYDSTLSKPIWSDGTTWRDAMGTAV